MIKKWYVYGAGGFGAETMDILLDMLANSNNAGFVCEFLVKTSQNMVQSVVSPS